LVAVVPEKQWNFELNTKLPRPKEQDSFYYAVSQLFPDNNVMVNTPAFHSPFMVYDVFIPELSLAVQYIRDAHEFFQERVFGILKVSTSLANKRQKSFDNGVTLIEVPFWWDRSVHSLAAMITIVRPDHIIVNKNSKVKNPKHI